MLRGKKCEKLLISIFWTPLLANKVCQRQNQFWGLRKCKIVFFPREFSEGILLSWQRKPVQIFSELLLIKIKQKIEYNIQTVRLRFPIIFQSTLGNYEKVCVLYSGFHEKGTPSYLCALGIDR